MKDFMEIVRGLISIAWGFMRPVCTFIGLMTILIRAIPGEIKAEHRWQNDAPRIAVVCQQVDLTASEQSDLKSAFAERGLTGSDAQLNRWVSRMQKTGRYGLLTVLPKDFHNDDVVEVGEKKILVPHEK